MDISNRRSRRKQNRAALKNNSKSSGEPSHNSPFFLELQQAMRRSVILTSDLRSAFYEYTHAIQSRYVASSRLARAIFLSETHIKNWAHFPIVLGPPQIELAMLERQLGSAGLN
jgi:hypothetical protein